MYKYLSMSILLLAVLLTACRSADGDVEGAIKGGSEGIADNITVSETLPGIPTATLSPLPSDTPQPAATDIPRPTSTPAFCPGALATRINVGDRARVPLSSEYSTLREVPNGKEIMKMPAGTEFTVIDGPVCTEGQRGSLIVWMVRLNDGTTGWVAEGYPDTGYWIEPVY